MTHSSASGDDNMGVSDTLVSRLRGCPSIDNARILPIGQRVPEVIVPTAVADEAADLIESQASLLNEAREVLEPFAANQVLTNAHFRAAKAFAAKLKSQANGGGE